MIANIPYDPRAYPPFAVTADIALFTIRDGALNVLLVQRGEETYFGAWALPGGFVRPAEDLKAAAERELEEETGLAEGRWHLEQLAAYGAPDRDPRMRVVTIAHWGVCSDLPNPKGGGDAGEAHLRRVEQIEKGSLRLAFDHERIVRDAVERIRSKMEHTALAAEFCPPEFTVRELRQVYETVWDTRLDPGNFHRYVRESGAFEKCASPRVQVDGIQKEPGTRMNIFRPPQRGRPASLWAAKRTEDGRPATAARTLARPGRAARRSQ